MTHPSIQSLYAQFRNVFGDGADSILNRPKTGYKSILRMTSDE